MDKTKTSKISTISIILMLTFSVTVFLLPTTNAQAGTKQTYPYIGAIPNPVGVNQPVLLHIGITDATASTNIGWENLTVTVTLPDGSIETLGPYTTDSTGGIGAIYVPTFVGTYTLQTHFPQQEAVGFGFFTGLPPGTIMLESESEILELVVQEEAIEYYAGHSLPNEYWSRPIDAQLREWSIIAGSWLATPDNLYAPYNDGPESAHILWRAPLLTGGLVGGELGDHAYECGDAYEGFWSNSIILGGVLYFNRYKDGLGPAYPTQEVVAIDLHSGEELWAKTLGNNERIAFGQNFYWDSHNNHGTYDYIWTTSGSTWNAYDAFSGVYVYSMENVPSGNQLYGAKGEIYRYNVDLGAGWMTLWNSSRVVSTSGSWMGGFMGQGYITYNATQGVEWNKTIPTDLPGSVLAIFDDRILGGTADSDPMQFWAISLESGNEGDLIFESDFPQPDGDVGMVYKGAGLEEGIFVISAKENTNHYAFSLDDGELVWSTTDSQYYLDSLDYWTSATRHTVVVEGKFISVGSGGIVYAYNAQTGNLDWTYEASDPYQEILWGNNWPLHIAFITDGKIYLTHDEHSPIDPKPRGAPFICLDLENGDVVWRIDGAFRGAYWGGRAIIGDSIIATYDSYDQQVYAIGKGPSATTVTALPKVTDLGSSVMIEGTVMDVSPGTTDPDLALRFPNGVPAVSDASMNEWMLYLYKQFEKPDNVMGVQVKLEAYDPNGNYQLLGTTTTDEYGNFGLMYEPEVPGTYYIYATFEGSDSYYSSAASTYLGVDPAPTPATPIEPEPTETEPEPEPTETEPTPTDTEPEPEIPIISSEVMIVAVVAVAAIIGVAAYWALRRRG